MDAQDRSESEPRGRQEEEDAPASLQEELAERIRRSRAWIRKMDDCLARGDDGQPGSSK